MFNHSEPAATPKSHPLVALLPKSKKIEALAAGFVLAQAAGTLIQKWKERQRALNTVVLKFQEGTEEYRWLCRWLSKLPRIESESQGRAFTARHLHAGHHVCAPIGHNEDPPAESRKREWALVPDNLQGFKFEDMTLGISREEPKGDGLSVSITRAIVMTCVTRDMDAVERLLASIFEAGNTVDHAEHIPRVLALTTWGDWAEIRKAPSNRTPVLPSGVLESLLADAAWFSANEGWYHSVGVPYRRGYLLHGVPGSGKTTTAICLASKLRKDIYLLPLEGLSDEKMANAIRNAGRDGVLLIEDIDCAAATNDRSERKSDSRKDAPTLMGLLNSIDGAATPEGRILIATTNRREVLDSALIRPGRFDRQFEFTHADFHQIHELCLRFGLNGEAEQVATNWHVEQVSMAEVQKRLIERCGIGGV